MNSIPGSLEEGYKYWADEAESTSEQVVSVPYIPLVGLLAVYNSFETNPERHTSFAWRQSVIESVAAMDGLRTSLKNIFPKVVELDIDCKLDIEYYYPEHGKYVSWQRCRIIESVRDGLPEEATTITAKEEFLAKNLGLLVHDEGFSLENWGLINNGIKILTSRYPKTQEMLTARSTNFV